MKKLLSAMAFGLVLAGMVQAKTSFYLKSADFANGSAMPVVHEGNDFGCSGRNLPPTLSWSGEPKSTRSFALTVVDSDAASPGGFVHWVIYNIPVGRHSVDRVSLRGLSQGQNDAGISGYFGPCPPAGDAPHHYHFTLYALDLRRISGSSLTLGALRSRMNHHILARTTLIGTFVRKN